MGSNPVKRVAIVGAGPAGAIAIDAFAQEQALDVIRCLSGGRPLVVAGKSRVARKCPLRCLVEVAYLVNPS